MLRMIQGSLEVKLRTIWTDEKQRSEETEKRREEERRSEKRKGQKKEDAGEPSGRMRDEQLHAVVARSTFRSETLLEVKMLNKCRPLWRDAHFEVKSVKN